MRCASSQNYDKDMAASRIAKLVKDEELEAQHGADKQVKISYLTTRYTR